MYLQGRPPSVGFTPSPPAEAVRWFRAATEAGDVDAMFNLGAMYEGAQGVLQDLELALQWYHRAGAAGHEGAQQAERRLGGALVTLALSRRSRIRILGR